MKDRRTFLKATTALAAMAGVFGYKSSQAKNSSNSMESAKGLLQHQVYFWLKSTVTDADRKVFEKGLRDLVGGIKEVHSSEIGIPAKTEARGVVDLSFGYSLLVWFKSIKEHDIYQTHAVHLKFIDDHSALWEKVVVYDSTVI
ncbi:MAG: Dabb family protein [Cyclobacteriaceae bacterium]|nr:Dabb family protein [Cyclobacteriaceae bacterium]